MDQKLNIIVMTQEDAFFIPHNIRKLMQAANVVEIVGIDCKSSMKNKYYDYYQWFGLLQCMRMGLKTISRKVERIVDKVSGFKYLAGECSIEDVAKANQIPFLQISDSNDEAYIEHVKRLQPDLIVSYSAPQIIKEELLSVPKHGIINVHGSLLPDYRGCLPSFWYLYNEETVGGATVHYMSKKIDDGDIIEQGTVDLSNCKSMFQVMKKTKKLGGNLMVKAVKNIANGTAVTRPNISSEGRYCTWPTKEEGKEFRKKGFRLY